MVLKNAVFILLCLIQMINEFIKITLQVAVALKDNSSQFLHKSSLEKNGSYKVSARNTHTTLILGEED